jgi:hypothetical protein
MRPLTTGPKTYRHRRRRDVDKVGRTMEKAMARENNREFQRICREEAESGETVVVARQETRG